MVKVRDSLPLNDSGKINIGEYLKRLNAHDKNIINIESFTEIIHNLMLYQVDSINLQSGLMIVELLDEMGLGTDTLTAGLLWGALGCGAKAFSDKHKLQGIDSLLIDLQKFDELSTHNVAKDPNNIDKIKKMLLAVVDDIRVVMIKLAHHTCEMHQATKAKEDRKIFLAELSENIYSPLANRLGIGQLKWELEDLSFRFKQPQAYKNIAKLLDEKRINRQDYISNVVHELNVALIAQEISGEISGRAKHIYSIWKKMKRKMVPYNEIYDVRALRIVTDTIADCYSVLGVIHSIWQHVPKEFDDYIANPKANGYQSLHTAVVGPEGRVLEVQIRTREMHDLSELGIASHWRYKEGGKYDELYQQKIAEIRALLDWHNEFTQQGATPEIANELFEDQVYVLTPKGDIIDLPQDSTPLDFAYAIHTEVGHKCRGAKINGKMCTLTSKLKSGSIVEIITAKQGRPSRDWLNPSLQFVKTTRAKAKIQAWLKKQNRSENINDGREALIKEVKRLGIAPYDLAELIKATPNCRNEDEFYISIAVGDIKIGTIINTIHREERDKREPESFVKKSANVRKPSMNEICIDGVNDMMYRTAKCCNPLPGEEIVGYVTIGNGVSVHKKECGNIINAKSRQMNRMIEVKWGQDTSSSYSADIIVYAYQRGNLLKDITSVLAKENVDVIGIDTDFNNKNMQTTFKIKISVGNIELLSNVMHKIQRIPNIVDISRVV
ncbi:MAG: bifunctional (p)ppGpp synthetase/guanosine-3',5'-bis(diphosphate) 3'-pyrophosphohydrolase [Francisellaceae bacterium]|nr:bifunctional (p)ppGpp synthetase/guanosine-3',5'-bis(diphosphate) 3'-pyrophosphohydrolase [Francisellaceae bacterium]